MQKWTSRVEVQFEKCTSRMHILFTRGCPETKMAKWMGREYSTIAAKFITVSFYVCSRADFLILITVLHYLISQ